MEEYIELHAKKARRRGQTFNWETATYGKIYCDTLDFFTDFEADFLAIVYNDALTSNQNISSEPTISIYNEIKTDFDFIISFFNSDDEDYTFICDKNSFSYKLFPVNNLKPEPINDNVEINTELCLENIDIKPMDSVVCISNDTTPVESDKYLETNHYEKSKLSETSNFILIIKVSYENSIPCVLTLLEFTYMAGLPLRAPRNLWLKYAVEGYIEKIVQDYEQSLDMIFIRQVNRVLILDFARMTVEMSTYRIDDTEMGLDTADTLCFQLGRARRSMTWRRFILALGLHTIEEIAGDGFETY
ncbi:hypothetical protein Tco_1351641 [Tanacetum coccineum]